jgi:hypothetical protein
MFYLSLRRIKVTFQLRLRLFLSLFVLVCGTLSFATQVPTLSAVLLSTAPNIDGVIDGEEWSAASKIDALRDRVTGQVPAVDTTAVYLGYTKEGIYFAYDCRDSEPSKIIGREVIPNAEFRGEDTITVDINLFGTRAFDQLNAFTVNAIGTQTERIAGGRSNKREWRGAWKAATKITETGWQCEIFIPWKILNYPNQANINCDLNLIRRQGRTLFEQSWANFRPNPLPELQGIWNNVQPPPPPKAKPQFLAYTAIEAQNTFAVRTGLDIKYPFTSSLNGVVSLAPDFRNIEDVIAGNDFVRTERFLNDPRTFFQEGANFYDLNERFSFGRMFYSRRVDQFDVGAKAFGLVNPKLSIGALYTNNFDGGKTALIKVNNTISGTQNQRVYATQNFKNGVENSAIGGGFFKRWDTIAFSVDAAAERNNGEDFDTGGTVQLNYIRPTTNVSARYVWVEPDFNPSLGFIPWTNRKGGYVFINNNRDWRKGYFRDYRINAQILEYRTYDTNEIQEGGWNANLDLSTRSDLGINFRSSRQTYFGNIDEVSGVDITINRNNRFRQIRFGYENGIRNDKPSQFTSVGTSWRLQNNFDVSFNQTVLEFDGTNRQSILAAQYQIGNDQLISTRIAQTNAGTNAYFSYRKAGNAGTEYYVILGDPNAETTQTRIALKLIWAF